MLGPVGQAATSGGGGALYVDDRCDYKLGGVGWVGTQVTQCPQADQLTTLPCPTTSEQEPSCFSFLGPEEAKDEKGPLISHPNPVR